MQTLIPKLNTLPELLEEHILTQFKPRPLIINHMYIPVKFRKHKFIIRIESNEVIVFLNKAGFKFRIDMAITEILLPEWELDNDPTP